MNRNYLSYDIECYPNIFTFTLKDHQDHSIMVFEVSERRDDTELLIQWFDYWKVNNYRGVGFNNLGYDYPVCHAIYTRKAVGVDGIYQVSKAIIDTPWNDRFSNRIPQWNHVFEQVDLYLINHFDNMARSTSLKQLEFVMRAMNIEDLPYPVGQPIPLDGFDPLIEYNKHDVNMTYDFFKHCEKAIQFRDVMSEKTGGDYLNYNDTKIGKQYFIDKLIDNGVNCFRTEYDQELGRNRKVPIQTHRKSIDLSEVVFDYIKFKTTPFQNVLNQIKSKVITETKGSLTLSATYDGFKYDFGTGGIHGSRKNQTFYADDDYAIFDWDVASYYPNIAIANRIYPEHLSTVFCDVYEDVYIQRKSYPKGTPENKAMKLALNGVYGDSNSKWSTMFDSKYTMAVTVNGQLMLCMLAEEMMSIPDLTMIQINTDGLTFKLPRKHLDRMYQIVKDWETLTKLELEAAEYSKMAVRDVNNYIAITTDGKTKFKGAYVHSGAHEDGELDWNKNHSALVVQKAVKAAVIDGIPIRKFILQHDNMFDFMMLVKGARSHRIEEHNPVYWGDSLMNPAVKTSECQRTTRYYVSKQGCKLMKVMPPVKRTGKKVKMVIPNWQGKKATGLNKNYDAENYEHYMQAKNLGYRIMTGGDFYNTDERCNEVEAGHLVTVVNRLTPEIIAEMKSNIDHEYYVKKAEDLVNNLNKGA